MVLCLGLFTEKSRYFGEINEKVLKYFFLIEKPKKVEKLFNLTLFLLATGKRAKLNKFTSFLGFSVKKIILGLFR